ncbi:MAG TPA: isopeptide-forming domain-containing fimbrial protein, partial [Aggregatilineales bacterium]|nr:isopeptide-forming domain-containing fimbrial protein [Aggregatilineales bacterium]
LPNAGTSDVPATIGEIVRYQLTITVPEATHNDLLLIDQLPTGLELIADSTLEITTANFGAGNFNSIDFGAGLNAANGGIVDLHNGTIYLFTSPFNLVDYNTGTNLLTFNLGDIVNSDADADIETITISFNAVVRNTAVTNIGNTIPNDFDVFVDDTFNVSQLATTSNVVTLIIEEPVITLIKSINTSLSDPTGTTSFDGGDTVIYDIVVIAGNTANMTTAFDLIVTDAIDPNLDLIDVDFIGTPLYATTADNSDYVMPVQTVSATITELRVGDSITIRVTATVRNTVTIGQIIPNSVAVTWSSLPGNQGTGNTTPGNSGDTNGERNGNTAGENDYIANNAVNFTVTGAVNTIKTIDGTSES